NPTNPERKQAAHEADPADILSTIDPEEISEAESRLPSGKEVANTPEFQKLFYDAAGNGDLPLMCLLHQRGVGPNGYIDEKEVKHRSFFNAIHGDIILRVRAALLLLQWNCHFVQKDFEWILYKLFSSETQLVPILIREMR